MSEFLTNNCIKAKNMPDYMYEDLLQLVPDNTDLGLLADIDNE